MGKLDGKVALITGGSSGIGFASAREFVAEGAFVFITGRRELELTAAAEEIGGTIAWVRADVSRSDDLDRLVKHIKTETGKLDIVFANAERQNMRRSGRSRRSSTNPYSTSMSKVLSSPSRNAFR